MSTRSDDGDAGPAGAGSAPHPATSDDTCADNAGDDRPLDAPHPWGEPSLRVSLLPRDTNSWGAIFGGVILSHIDLAGGVEAHKISERLFVTVAMKEVVFHEPVFVGDVVSFYTCVERVGRTSVTIKVLVEALRPAARGRQRVKVTEAKVVYVAIDENHSPTPVFPEKHA